jgi:zinc transporter ZupT
LVDAAREEDDAAVLTAVLFGLAASSALVIGALVGARWNPPKQVTGVLLAFASSALISALAFELFEGVVRDGWSGACRASAPRGGRDVRRRRQALLH